MTKHVIETVTFKLNEGVSREGFAAAAQAMNDFVIAQPGFISRRPSCGENGQWIEHIEWADMDAAKAAAANIGLSKPVFQGLFAENPARPPKGGVVEGPWDFTQLDRITPHLFGIGCAISIR